MTDSLDEQSDAFRAHALGKMEEIRREIEPLFRSDEDRAMEIELEQARLVAYGALGTLAVVWSAALATDRYLCLFPLKMGSGLLLVAAGLAVSSISFCATARTQRGTAHLARMAHWQAIASGDKDAISRTEQGEGEASREVGRSRNTARWLATVGATFGWLAVPVLIVAIERSLNCTCGTGIWAPVDPYLRWMFG